MKLKLIIANFMFITAYSDSSSDLLVDYFTYKNVQDVIGFSCDSIEENMSLLKYLSNIGMTTTINKLNNSSKIHEIVKTSYWKLGVFLDLRCYDLQGIPIFSDALEHRMFEESYCWLILRSNLDDVVHLIDGLALGLSTDVVIAVSYNRSDEYKLYDVYNTSTKRKENLNITYLGCWDEESRLVINFKQPKLERRSNLNGRKVRTIVMKSAQKPKDVPLVEYLNDYAHATYDGNSKFGLHVIEHLSDMYNFSLEFFESDSWMPNDTRGPLVKALMNGSADFTASSLVLSSPRTYWVKFVHQGWLFRTCFIFRNPQIETISVQEILRPFEKDVWHVMFLFIVLIVLSLIIVLNYEECNGGILKFSNSCILIASVICQQGTDIQMSRISTRIIFLFAMVFSFLLYNYYSASIVSARLDKPIYKINDSLNQFGKLHMNMASQYLTYLEYFLKQPDWDSKIFYENYWSKLPESERYMKPEDGMPLVRDTNFAYHTHPDVVYPFIDKNFNNREVCELVEVHVARPFKAGIATGINGQFVEIARVGLARITEVGLSHRQILRWTFRKPHCRKDILSVSSVNFFEFAPHLVILVIGILLSIILWALEVIIAHFDISFNLKLFHYERVLSAAV